MIELTFDQQSGRMGPQIKQVKSLLVREAQTVRFHENVKFLLNHGASNYQEAQQMLIQLQQDKKLVLNSRAKSIITLVDTTDVFAANFGTTNFDIFSIYLSNLCSLVALKELFESGVTYQDIKQDNSLIKDKSKVVKDTYLPTAVKKWRNKVAAHYAAADPQNGDNVATIMQSINILPEYNSPYYSVGETQFQIAGRTSQLKGWAITKTYDELRSDLLSDCPELPVLLHNHYENGVVNIA
ncbi:hypothetical protein L4D11_08705 [Vibrio gigantis]|uniref:hypothetical protein n=1 Tax=Vibrio gigantis TaxID=296199 RepID=UPI003D09DBC9